MRIIVRNMRNLNLGCVSATCPLYLEISFSLKKVGARGAKIHMIYNHNMGLTKTSLVNKREEDGKVTKTENNITLGTEII